MKHTKYIIILILLITNKSIIFAQNKGIGDEEVVITKDRKIDLPPANRIFEKISAIQANKEEQQMKYTFLDRKPTQLEVIKITPIALTPDGGKKDEILSFNNHASVGFGNYGRLFGELFLNSDQTQPMVWGVHARHNATSKGPVLDKNSATQNDYLGINGKYQTEAIKLTAEGSYDYQKYYFYGYQLNAEGNPAKTTFNLDSTKQRLNTYRLGLGIENMNAQSLVDYSLKTTYRYTKDLYQASEGDWATNFKVYFPILEKKLIALIDADAYISEHKDILENKILKDSRKLFRVKPAFKYNNDAFSLTVGYKAISQTDNYTKISNTSGYPSIDATYKFPGIIYAYAGYDGDVIRNTWGSFLQENPYLDGIKNHTNSTMLLNTEKTAEFYGGVKGDVGNGVSFNVKGSYGEYKNMAFFNNWNPQLTNAKDDSTRFKVLYDSLKTKVINGSLQVNYQPTLAGAMQARTYLKADYYQYTMGSLAKPFHRPNFIGTWGTTLIFANKLVVNTELYYYGASYAKNFEKNILYKNKGFVDLNAEFNYIFTKQLQAFVKLNNILNTNYERFHNYQQQGLNFLVGVNFSF